MRLLRVVAVAAVVATVVVQGGSELARRPAAHAAPVRGAVSAASYSPFVSAPVPPPPVPPQWGADNASGRDGRSVQPTLVTRAVVTPPRVVAVTAGGRPLRRPPRSAATGSTPPAGTAQAVLAQAYVAAVRGAAQGCHLRVNQLAAIGQVESGSVGGRSVDAGHRVTPAIYGPLLDGGPFAVVHDTDGGAVDGSAAYDRAVGPLQFLPGTWRWAGRDGDGDGRRDPQNVFDATAAAADYLCSGRDLSRPAGLRAAILAYNQSQAYLSTVLDWVAFFDRHGLAAMADVAFRVGSGGRASALGRATPAPAAAAEPQAAGAPTSRPTSTPVTSPTAPTSPPGPTPTPTGTGTAPAPAPQPAPPPTTTPPTTTPTPDPTTTTPVPDPTTAPVPPTTPAPTPVPEPTTPPVTTTAPDPPTSAPSGPPTSAPSATTPGSTSTSR